ncbi:unnamed protein product [Porites evermanni]|uniref:Methyltransferase domain-containing protein n=1 Tax=Porites evermanni TaxID=104178 RepID=A0ABN8LNZ0_9CNID|nr:unnamed protein product [Porites evermanni]
MFVVGRRCAPLYGRSVANLLFTPKGWLKMQFFGDMSDQSFWNNFYTSRQGNKHFDWFVHFEDVSGYLAPYLPSLGNNCPIPRIIDIGSGTSDFSLKLFNHLNRKCCIDLVDFSPEAIKIMQKILLEQGLLKKSVNPEDFPGIACHRADARNLPFKEHTFSLALDKGTSDAVLKGTDGETAFVDVVQESLRVLKPSGKLIQFSDEPPETNLNTKNCKLCFIWRELEINTGFQHFMYVVHKENC